MSRFSALSSLVLCVAQSIDGQHLPSGSFDNVAMLQSMASSGRVMSETDDAFIAHSSSHAQFWPFTARAPAVVAPKVDIVAVTANAEPISDDHHGVLDVIHRAHFHRAHKAAVDSTPQAHIGAAVEAKVEPIASNHHGVVDDVHHGVMRSDAPAPHQYQHRLPNFHHGPPQSLLHTMLATEKLLNAEAGDNVATIGATGDANNGAETDIGSVDEGEAKISVAIDAAADAVVGAGVAASSEESSSEGDAEQSAVAYDDSAEAGISAEIDEVSVNSDGEVSNAEDDIGFDVGVDTAVVLASDVEVEVTEAEAVDSGDVVSAEETHNNFDGEVSDADDVSAEADTGSGAEVDTTILATTDTAADATVIENAGAGLDASFDEASTKFDADESIVANDYNGAAQDMQQAHPRSLLHIGVDAEVDATWGPFTGGNDDGSDAVVVDDDDALDDDDDDDGSSDTEVDTTSTGEAPSSGPGLNDADTDFDSGTDEVITRTKQELTDAAYDSAFNPDAF